MSSQPKVAVFSFFKLYSCPPCNAFKGDPAGTKTDVPPNPEGPWEKLTADRDLIDAGVEFILFKFGTRRDPDGTTETFEVPPVYAKKVTSAPYLELRLPNDMTNGTRYEGSREWTTVKAWILEQLKNEPYKSYRQSVQQGRSEAYTTAVIKKKMMAAVNAEDVNVKGPSRAQAPSKAQQQQQPVRVQPNQQQQQAARVQPVVQQQPVRAQPVVQQQVPRPRVQVQQPQQEVQQEQDDYDDEDDGQRQDDYDEDEDYREEVQQANQQVNQQFGYRGEQGSQGAYQVTARGMATNPHGVPSPIQNVQVQYPVQNAQVQQRSVQQVQQQKSYKSAPQQSYQQQQAPQQSYKQQQSFQPAEQPVEQSFQAEQQTQAANSARAEKKAPRFKPANY